MSIGVQSDARQPGVCTPPRYALDPDGSFRIEQYDDAPAFSSFLPGVGGPAGVPLWCLYVNRAQAVVSFGVHTKDQAIAEYLPATWAYQLVGSQGFRTFCKLDGQYFEPFAQHDPAGSHGRRSMFIRPDSLALREEDTSHELVFDVEYFSPVNQPLGTLARILTITNHAGSAQALHVLDGLPLILPAGFTDENMKNMRHITEAYASVRRVCEHVPFYAAKVVAHDEPEVVRVAHGNFCAAWLDRGDGLEPLEPLVDPHIVFGAGHDLVCPRRFIAEPTLSRAAQVWENRLPCALTPFEAVLEPGESVRLCTLYGFAPNEQMLADYLAHFGHHADFDTLRDASRTLIDEVTAPAATYSALPALDGYARQNYLDNVLRGGVPLTLPSQNGPTLLHLYARRHGDLERDYNYFILPPHALSSGAGNYRDVCQNRRCDVWLYPEVGELEIKMFAELIQPDGYNPLAIEGYHWRAPATPLPTREGQGEGKDSRRSATSSTPAIETLCPTTNPEARSDFARLLRRPFQPGELLAWADRHAVSLPDRDAWLTNLLAQCQRTLIAHGHDGGYWIDHWTYLADLLEAYAGVYPDRVVEMLTGSADVGWVDDHAFVRPRSEKYQQRPSGYLQLDAVTDDPAEHPPLSPVTVLGKLCALLAIKAVSFDSAGRAIEMESGRPGWNDSLNGLPALFGSSTCEAAETARLARWLRENLPHCPGTEFPAEIAGLIDAVVQDMSTPEYSWERAAAIRENFRARIQHRTTTTTRTLRGAQLDELLAGVERRARQAIDRAVDPATGLMHTYYVNRPADAPPTTFESQPLPLYLEGQVHWLRVLRDPAQARAIYQATRRSPLFDADLHMYKLNECLDACSPDIGRARTFTRGWFENESIWLHMSYKYLLELLKAGLHDEFFADAKTMLVPFMDPQVYGRSILENSSFLASSANPDPHTRGRGFIARLSGSTAEFIHMWLLLTVGPNPFFVADDKLHFRVQPALPGAWFTAAPRTVRWNDQEFELPAGCFACALLGSILLVHHNASRRDTFGPDGVRPVRFLLDDKDAVQAPHLTGEHAQHVRARAYQRIDVWLE